MNLLSSQLQINSPSPEQQLHVPWKNAEQLDIWVKRDDLLHPIISGNKWRKLQFALQQIRQQHYSHIVSFGGGYSNHLHALAYCCKQLELPFTAIIRGDYTDNLTPMLHDIQHWGAQTRFVDRITYQQRSEPNYLASLHAEYPNACIIPEGGSQLQALAGVAEIIGELQQPYDVIIAPVASGGTLAGLINSSNNNNVIGIAVLKGKDYLESLVNGLLPSQLPMNIAQWKIDHRFHCGGYAKSTPELTEFCRIFSQHTEIPVEPVYSGKVFYAAKNMIEAAEFEPATRILILHTGGLQGAR